MPRRRRPTPGGERRRRPAHRAGRARRGGASSDDARAAAGHPAGSTGTRSTGRVDRDRINRRERRPRRARWRRRHRGRDPRGSGCRRPAPRPASLLDRPPGTTAAGSPSRLAGSTGRMMSSVATALSYAVHVPAVPERWLVPDREHQERVLGLELGPHPGDGVALDQRVDELRRVAGRDVGVGMAQEREGVGAHHLHEQRHDGPHLGHAARWPTRRRSRRTPAARPRRRRSRRRPGGRRPAGPRRRCRRRCRRPAGRAAARRAGHPLGRGRSSGTGTVKGSRTCGPAITRKATRTSATVRAIGPSVAISWPARKSSIGRDHGGRRDPPDRGLERRDAAAVRRVAERAADVVAEADRCHARGQRRGLAATRPAGRQRRGSTGSG